MISTKRLENDDTVFQGEEAALVQENGQETLDLVQAALAAGLTEFTTPTTGDDEGRIDWKTSRWLIMKGGKPTVVVVAYKVLNAHFEVVGPESPLVAEAPKIIEIKAAAAPAAGTGVVADPAPAEKTPKIPIPARK